MRPRARLLNMAPGLRQPPRNGAGFCFASRSAFARNRRHSPNWSRATCGKPIVEAEFDIADVATCFEYYGGLATKVTGHVNPVPDNALSLSLKEPGGVAAQIIPWNYPLLMAAWKLAPAAGRRLYVRAETSRADAS